MQICHRKNFKDGVLSVSPSSKRNVSFKQVYIMNSLDYTKSSCDTPTGNLIYFELAAS